MSINKAILIGNVGQDPTIRKFEGGASVATFSLATTERGYTLANGTQVPERTEWHNIVAWRGIAELAEKYIRKGTKIYIEGKITTRSWEKDGITRYTTEIIAEKVDLLSAPPQRQDQQTNAPTQTGAPAGYTPRGVLSQDQGQQPEPQFNSEPSTNQIGAEDDLPF